VKHTGLDAYPYRRRGGRRTMFKSALEHVATMMTD
jgi:hypothetical protein